LFFFIKCHAFRSCLASLDDLGKVKAQVVVADAKLFTSSEQVEHLRILQKSLGWNAAPVQTNATQPVAFHQGRFHSQLGSPHRCGVPPRAGTDDNQIKCIRILHSRLLCSRRSTKAQAV
jgi:hypothetical protein